MQLCLTARPSNPAPDRIGVARQATRSGRRFTGDGPPARRHRILRACLIAIATLVAVAGLDSAAAFADSGKVLVFTGTAGSPNAADPAAVSAINAAAAANGLTADATGDATSINATKLAGYRAVVFVNSSGDVLTPRRSPISKATCREAAASSASARPLCSSRATRSSTRCSV